MKEKEREKKVVKKGKRETPRHPEGKKGEEGRVQ